MLEAGGEAGDGGRLEEITYSEFGTERGADAADEAGGEEGVSAEVEEVVVDPDAVHAVGVAGAAGGCSRAELRRGKGLMVPRSASGAAHPV